MPTNSASNEGPAGARWAVLGGGAVVLTLLLIATWYAGRESAGLEEQHLSTEMQQIAQKLADTEFALNKEKAKVGQQEKALNASGKTPDITVQSQLRQQLLKAQAEANQYKAIIEREQRSWADNSLLLDAFSNPGVRVVPLKAIEPNTELTAYALLVENSRLVFVASHLPALADGRQFQLWIHRKQDPEVVSAGTFNANADNRTIISIENPSLISDISSVEVTEEPEGGSASPSGAKLLESIMAIVEPS